MTSRIAPPTVPHPALEPPKFLDRLRTALLIRGTEPEVAERYVDWVRQFIRFHRLRHPEESDSLFITATDIRSRWVKQKSKRT